MKIFRHLRTTERINLSIVQCDRPQSLKEQTELGLAEVGTRSYNLTTEKFL